MIDYQNSPGNAPVVTVEWVDITGGQDSAGATLRWTLGHLLSVDHESEGIPCVVTAITWDEDGW